VENVEHRATGTEAVSGQKPRRWPAPELVSSTTTTPGEPMKRQWRTLGSPARPPRHRLFILLLRACCCPGNAGQPKCVLVVAMWWHGPETTTPATL
jgi:hypothetical protein